MPTALEIAQKYSIAIIPLSNKLGGGFKAGYPQFGLTVAGYGQTPAEALANLQEITPFAFEGIAPEDMPAP
jgi:predicted RNase H-like HicB family nuclease